MNQFTFSESYTPLYVAVINDDAPQRSFTVKFTLTPICSIQVEGVRPTFEEFCSAFKWSTMPLLALEAVYVATMVAFDHKEAQESQQ